MKKHAPLKPLISIFVFIALLGCADSQTVKQSSQAIEVPVITAVRVSENSIIIQGNKEFTYTLYKTGDPYRVSVEIPDMNAGPFTEKIVSDSGMVTELLPQQIDSPTLMTRIDIVLQSPASLTPEYKDKTLILSIKKDDPTVLTEAKNLEADPKPVARLVAIETPAEKETTPVTAKATEINSITVKKSADTVKVIISGNGTMIPNVFPVNERIVVDIPETALHAVIPSQALSPLKGIRAGKHKDKLRIVLDLKEKTNFDVTAIGNTIEISLMNKDYAQPQRASYNAPKESTMGESPAAIQSALPDPITEGVYTGKKISLDFQDADIIPIFRLLGDISGYNMVVNPEVKGKITLKLINVPWDQALDIIMRTFNLSKIVDGNIIRVLPTSAVAKELDDLKNTKKAQAEAGNLITKIFSVNYAEMSKLKDAIDKAKLLSSRGSISLDERGSSIIVNDLDANIEQIAALIKEIDQEHMQARQVIIEARIIEVNADYSKDLGVQWGGFYRNPPSNGDNNFFVNRTGSSNPQTSLPALPLVNLPAAASVGNLGLGFINKAATLGLSLQLSAMESSRKGKIISSPRLMTMNNTTARIKTGRQLQLPTTSQNGTTLTAVPIYLELEVTPRIAPGGGILMKTKITKDEFIEIIYAGDSAGVDTTKNEIDTTVLINDGETLVIGGIIKQQKTDNEDAVPGLSKLPLLGYLFKNEGKKDATQEVLVFLTPRIVEFNSMR